MEGHRGQFLPATELNSGKWTGSKAQAPPKQYSDEVKRIVLSRRC